MPIGNPDMPRVARRPNLSRQYRLGVEAWVLCCLFARGVLAAQMEDIPRGPNMFPNGSFEVGFTPVVGRAHDSHSTGQLGPSDISDHMAAHGKYSLYIPTYYTRQDPTLVRQKDFFTMPFRLKSGRVYAFSCLVRRKSGEGTFRLSAAYPATLPTGKTKGLYVPIVKGSVRYFKVTDNHWTFCETYFPGDDRQPIHVRFEAQDSYIDALALQVLTKDIGALASETLETAAKEEPTEAEAERELHGAAGPEEVADRASRSYRTATPIEVGAFTDLPGHIFYHEDGTTIPLRFFNGTDRLQSVAAEYEITNQYGVVWRKGATEPLDVPANGYARSRLDLGQMPHGKYSMVYWPKGYSGGKNELCFDVLPKPVPGLVGIHGIHTTACKETLGVYGRGGFGWYSTLTDGAFRLEAVWDPATGKVRDERSIAEMVKASGMMAAMCLEPPKWPKKALVTEQLPSRHPDPLPDMADYAPAVEALAAMYSPYFPIWYVGDECDGTYQPEQYVPFLREVVRTIRSVAPKAQILVSANGAWFERFFRAGGEDLVDYLGGSVMGQMGNEGRKLGWLALRYGKKMWATGGFAGEATFYRTHAGGPHANESLYHQLLFSFFYQHADGTSPYIGRPISLEMTGVGMPHNLIEHDCSLTSALCLYAIAGTMLAGAERDFFPFTTDTYYGRELWRFRCGRSKRAAVCFFPGPAQTVTIQAEPRQLEYRDALFNVVPVNAGPNGTAQCDIGPGFAYLYDNGLGADRFYEQLAKARTTLKPPAEVKAGCYSFYALNDKSELERVTMYYNAGAEPYRFVPPGQKAPLVELAPGESKRFREPAGTPSARYPMLPAIGPAYGHRLWLVPCPRVPKPITLDGNLAEWLSRWSASLYINYWDLNSLDMGEVHGWRNSFQIMGDFGQDYRVDWWCAHDAENLYLAALVCDDVATFGESEPLGKQDKLTVLFDFDLEQTRPHPTTQPRLAILPLKSNNAVLEIETDRERRRLTATGAVRAWSDEKTRFAGYNIELCVPWAELGAFRPKGKCLIGIDLIATDVDVFGPWVEDADLRWAGGACPTGQAILFPE